MPFDMIGWGEAAPGTGVQMTAGLGEESIYSVNGDDIVLNKDITKLLGVFVAAESTGGETRLRQPTLKIDHTMLKCMLGSDNDPTQGFTSFLDNPLPLIPSEKLNALQNNATDEDRLIGAMVGNQALPRKCDPTHIIRGYADTTLTAFEWGLVTVTWLEDLPFGRYAVVGMQADYFIAAGPLGAIARVVCPTAPWRPGVPAALAEADHEECQSVSDLPWWIWGLMDGVEFHSSSMPNIEYASGCAATDENFALLLQKLD